MLGAKGSAKAGEDLLLRGLRRRRKRAKNAGRDEELSDVYLELGDYYRSSTGHAPLLIKAGAKYEKAIACGKRANANFNVSLAYRAIAELALDEGNENAMNRAVRNIAQAVSYAIKSNNPSQIQLVGHQRAFILNECGQAEQALEVGVKDLRYLEKVAMQIDRDPHAVEMGGTSERRRAGLENLLAAISMKLGKVEEARQYNEHCIEFARKKGDYDLLYRGLNARLQMAKGRERLTIANDMRDAAEKTDKKSPFRTESLFHLGMEQVRFDRVREGRRKLWWIYKLAMQNLAPAEQEEVRRTLVFIYKTERRMELIKELVRAFEDFEGDPVENKTRQARIHEKIADEAADLEFYELAYKHYELMSQLADTSEDKRRAYLSVAVTAVDLENRPTAVRYFDKLLQLERRMRLAESELLSTEISIAKCKAEDPSLSIHTRLEAMHETYQKCASIENRLALLPTYIKLLEKATESELGATMEELNDRKAELTELTARQQSEGHGDGEEEDEQEDATHYTDEYEEMNELELFREIKMEMRAIEQEEQMRAQKNQIINPQGETNLHIAARVGDVKHLERLIKMGYDVNVLDYGGWSPLSEAVIAGNEECVRILLQCGANVNVRSREYLLNKEGGRNEEEGESRATAGGQSSLMEACANGSAGIIRLLLQHSASVLQKDDDGWTAVDHLNEYLSTRQSSLDSATLGEFIALKEQMEGKQRAAGFQPRAMPPPRREVKKGIKLRGDRLDAPRREKSRKRRRRAGDNSGSSCDEEELGEEGLSMQNFLDYRQAIKRLGPRQARSSSRSGQDTGMGATTAATSRYILPITNPDSDRLARKVRRADRLDATVGATQQPWSTNPNSCGPLDDYTDDYEELLPEDHGFIAPEDDEDEEDEGLEFLAAERGVNNGKQSQRRVINEEDY